MVGPWIHALWSRGRKLSDIEYLSIKEFDGKLVKNMGAQRTTAGTLATLTASSGKDMYLARASVALHYDGTGTPGTVIELQINGTAVETLDYDARNIGNEQFTHYFTNIGHKVAATQAIRIEVISTANTVIEGFVECFEETTGDSPAIS